MKKKNEDLSEAEKEENDEYLRKLVRNLNNKEKYSPYDRDDFDYYGIRDIENLFYEFSKEDNYKYYESRGDKEKKIISKTIS